MPSSTSSSNQRLPAGPWGRTWALALVLVVAFVGTWEASWRLQGFRPALSDDAGLWGLTRAAIADAGRDAVVLVGASRIHFDLDPRVFSAALNGRPTWQLAIDGSSALPVLEHLANDRDFNGLAVCSIPPAMCRDEQETLEALPRAWLQEYERRAATADLEQRLRMLVQRTFVFRLPEVSPPEALRRRWTGGWPEVPHLTTHADRSRYADFSRVRLHLFRQRVEEHCRAWPPGLRKAHFSDFVERVRDSVERIRARGGEVVLLRLPSTGAVRQIEREKFPRERYWDVLVAGTRARAVHFEDHPSLQGFACPEGSHLSVRDVARFTEALAEVVADVASP